MLGRNGMRISLHVHKGMKLAFVSVNHTGPKNQNHKIKVMLNKARSSLMSMNEVILNRGNNSSFNRAAAITNFTGWETIKSEVVNSTKKIDLNIVYVDMMNYARSIGYRVVNFRNSVYTYASKNAKKLGVTGRDCPIQKDDATVYKWVLNLFEDITYGGKYSVVLPGLTTISIARTIVKSIDRSYYANSKSDYGVWARKFMSNNPNYVPGVLPPLGRLSLALRALGT